MSSFAFIDPVELVDKDIFTLLKLEKAPEATKQKIAEDMVMTIQSRVVARLMDALSEEESKQFDALIAENDEAKISQFLLSKNIDVKNIAAQEMLYYKSEMVSAVLNKQAEASKEA